MFTGERSIEPSVSVKPAQEGQDVTLAVAGDQRAFERLYRTHHARVFSLAMRMAGTQWAEDLTQEVFIRAWTRDLSAGGLLRHLAPQVGREPDPLPERDPEEKGTAAASFWRGDIGENGRQE